MTMVHSSDYRILFVCMGNICRSPAAEIIFTAKAEARGLSDRIRCDSAGTTGYHIGNPPDSRMIQTLEQHGYRVFGSARKVKHSDLEEFDLILAADHDNLRDLQKLDKAGKFRDKIRLLTDYTDDASADHVPDPYYGGIQGFEEVVALVEDCCDGLLESLQSQSDKA